MILAALGTWQLRRMGDAGEVRVRVAERVAQPAFDVGSPPDDAEWRRARVVGTPDWGRHVLVAGRYLRDQPGFELVVPVRTSGATVMVDLGWIPGDGYQDVIAHEAGVAGERRFEGLVRVYAEDDAARGALPAEPDGFQRLWRTLSPRAMAQGVDVLPFVVVDGEQIPEGRTSADREPPIGGWHAAPPQRPHGEYALTWYAILAVLLGLWVYGSLERR